jgi:hypothetical protein
MRGTLVKDIREAIDGLPDDMLVFGQDEQADFYEESISFKKMLASPKFFDNRGMHYYKDLLNPDLDEEEIAEAREKGKKLVKILTVSISR